MHKAKTVDPASFDMPDFYERLENANREAGMRPVNILRSSFELVSKLISMVSYIAALVVILRKLPFSGIIFQDFGKYEEIYMQFDKLREGKTSIFVSHRLSSATIADKVVVLENGCVAEVGSHEELMELRGKYYKLFSTQAARYGKS